MRWMATLLMVCALATGCESDKDNGGGGKLVGTKWRLQAWSASSLDPTRFNITAEFGDAQISGTAAVNLYGGPYTASDGNFSVGDLDITQMAGSEAAMRAEAIYMDLLGQARHYEVTGTTLTLRNASHQTTLVFRSTGQKIPEF